MAAVPPDNHSWEKSSSRFPCAVWLGLFFWDSVQTAARKERRRVVGGWGVGIGAKIEERWWELTWALPRVLFPVAATSSD